MKTIVIDSPKESGKEVALRVSEQTGIPVFNTQTVIDTAEQLGADAAYLKRYDEDGFGSLIYSLFISSNCYENYTVQKSFSALAEAIRLLYHKNNGGIFMGKFAAEILSELDTVFVARIESAHSSRSARRQDIDSVSKFKPRRQGHSGYSTVSLHGEEYKMVLQKSVKNLDQCASSIIHLAEL